MARFQLKTAGDGFEIVIGRISKEQYDFWRNNINELKEYAWDGTCEINNDDKYSFIKPGAWYDCDDQCHEKGSLVNEYTEIYVEDDDENVIWSSPLNKQSLIENGISEKNIVESIDISSKLDCDYAFCGKLENNGTIYSGYFEAKKFDPKKLKICISNVRGILIDAEDYSYDNEPLEEGDIDYTSDEFSIELIDVLRTAYENEINRYLEASQKFSQESNIEAAVQQIDKALSFAESNQLLSSEFIPILNEQKGIIYSNFDRLDEGTSYLIKSMDGFSEFYSPSSVRVGVISGFVGINFIRSNKHNDAIPYLEKCISLTDNYFRRFSLAKAYEAIGNDDKAKELYQIISRRMFNASQNTSETNALLAKSYIALVDLLKKSDENQREITRCITHAYQICKENDLNDFMSVLVQRNPEFIESVAKQHKKLKAKKIITSGSISGNAFAVNIYSVDQDIAMRLADIGVTESDYNNILKNENTLHIAYRIGLLGDAQVVINNKLVFTGNGSMPTNKVCKLHEIIGGNQGYYLVNVYRADGEIFNISSKIEYDQELLRLCNEKYSLPHGLEYETMTIYYDDQCIAANPEWRYEERKIITPNEGIKPVKILEEVDGSEYDYI